MSIIEREIEKRQMLIAEHNTASDKIKALRAEADELERNILNVDVDVLTAEIDELKTYLPKPDIIDSNVNEEVNI